MSTSIFFNAHHSPVGAFASFTLGHLGAKGGLGLELGTAANENLYIGIEKSEGEGYDAFPFFEGSEDESTRYEVAKQGNTKPSTIRPYKHSEVRREFKVATDKWSAGDLTFTIFSPVKAVPDPKGKVSKAHAMEVLVPAVFVELTADNTRGKRSRKLFFAYEGSDTRLTMRRHDDVSRGAYAGVGQGLHTAIVTNSPGLQSVVDITMERVLDPEQSDKIPFGLGGVGALMAHVPAGKKKTYRIAICFHKAGIMTSGIPCTYAYTKYFKTIEDVAKYAVEHWDDQRKLALASDRLIEKAKLNDAQKFSMSHAVRSYYGSTEYLECEGEPFWVVNEGEYRMMNTFDLTADHSFFEMAQNPWVLRNQLDWFATRFNYRDKVRLPGSDKEYPGGISFTHDMGIANAISRPGFSAYELAGMDGCFSHMTHEQLVNWVVCAVSYVKGTGDTAWLKKRLATFKACLESLVNRDHPDPKKRDGVMSTDSSRCDGGAEITTYDSLDVSLGQSRNNLYLAVKSWASYVGLREIFASLKDTRRARLAGKQASLCAKTICANMREDGFIPAVMMENNESRIIPAVEGLVFPKFWGMDELVSRDGEFGDLIRTLGKHLRTVLKKGVCLFDDGSWKLSSTNDNSWLSKIYLCQFVSRTVLGFPKDEQADKGHQSWLVDPTCLYFAWSDQVWAGKTRGSRYYPRGVTSWLWLSER